MLFLFLFIYLIFTRCTLTNNTVYNTHHCTPLCIFTRTWICTVSFKTKHQPKHKLSKCSLWETTAMTFSTAINMSSCLPLVVIWYLAHAALLGRSARLCFVIKLLFLPLIQNVFIYFHIIYLFQSKVKIHTAKLSHYSCTFTMYRLHTDIYLSIYEWCGQRRSRVFISCKNNIQLLFVS